MSTHHNPTTDLQPAAVYQIRLEGHLSRPWTNGFEGFAVALEASGETVLTGPVADQAALHGLLRKVRDLGLRLVSVTQAESGRAHAYGRAGVMQAVVYEKYGPPDVLRLDTVDRPKPGAGEVLVRVHAAAANPHDWHVMRGRPLFYRQTIGLRKPQHTRLGIDIAGRVAELGRQAKQAVEAEPLEFQPGEAVFGITNSVGFAEYAVVPARSLAHKPDNLSYAAAASVPVGGFTALQGLRRAGPIRPGQQVLINGASGGVGTLAVQIARSLGARVTGVCSTRNLELVRSLGADHAVDYTREDFTRSGRRYDLILDLVGNRSALSLRRALSPSGACVIGGYTSTLRVLDHVLLGSLLSKSGSRWIGLMGIAKFNRADLLKLRELLEAGAVVPVVDRRYPLSETAEAIRYLETKRARGKVVITVHQDRSTKGGSHRLEGSESKLSRGARE